MNKIKLISFALATVTFAALAFTFADVKVFAADTTVVVTDAKIARQAENTPPTRNWVLYTRNAGDATFRSGPDTPPLGMGSLEFNTPTGDDKATLFNYDHVSAALSAITDMRYSTYRSGGSDQQVTSINIQVDVNGNAAGGFTTLVFEPVYNTAQGPVTSGMWQSWDAYFGGNARWWSTRAIPGVCAFDCFVSWATIVGSNSDAVILGGFGLNQGSGNGALTVATDKLIIGYGGDITTYDFELLPIATAKEQCKAGGWTEHRRSDESLFRNQGDCVSYIETGN